MSTCAHCQDPLVLEIDLSDDDEDVSMAAESSSNAVQSSRTVPDDVTLPCGCHFHWQCLLDSYDIATCPSCSKQVTSSSASGAQQILCNLHNEGGLQENLDILPLLTEESYLRAYPEDRKCRAFLEFCREGDVSAIVELLKSCDEDSEDDDEDEDMDDQPKQQRKSADEILRYQDPIGDMQSGLHAAVSGGSREVAWLLLLLASNYPELEFPALVFQEAASLNMMRDDQTDKVDIRGLRDSDGKSAEDLAVEMEGVWHGWPGTKRLTI